MARSSSSPAGGSSSAATIVALRDVERQHLHLSAVGIIEPVGQRVVVDQAGELEDEVVTDSDADEGMGAMEC